jgi:putative selenate reductase
MWGSDHDLPLDTLVVAVGQEADLSLFDGESVEVNAAGFIDVDPVSHETSVPGLFAGGDLVDGGPSTIVKACGDGRRIAEAIAVRENAPTTLGSASSSRVVDRVDILRRRALREYRVPVPTSDADVRASFDETIATYDRDSAVAEAGRCLDCDLICSTCDSVCPNRAIITYQTDPMELHLPVLQWSGGEAQTIRTELFSIHQSYQVAVLADLCNECGNCTTFCPTAGQPFADKPRLFLDVKEFAAQKGNAFRISHESGSWKIEGVFNLCRHELVVDDILNYRSPTVDVRLDAETFAILEASPRDGHPPSEAVSLLECATLYVLFQGIRESVPWIPTAS